MYIQNKYNVTIEQNDTVGLKPPYIVLANHVNDWDPLFINCYVEEPLCFVAAAPLFRHPQLKKALNYAGAISKTKGRADRSTIKNILKAKKHNRAIALFPEGNRSWNGETDQIVYSTAKLIKLLGIPVVVANIKGGYLTQPRWSDHVRKGKITLSFKKIWDGKQVKALEVDDIHNALSKALYVDDIAYQQKEGILFKGQNLAQYLERYLYTCPHCQTIDNMYSQGNLFTCQHCQYSVAYNEAGTFDQRHDQYHFKTVKDWAQWQDEYIQQKVKEQDFLHTLQSNFHNDVTVDISIEEKPFESQGEFILSWQTTAIHFQHKTIVEKSFTISFNDLSALNVHLSRGLFFFFENNLYRVHFKDPRSSAYKWFQLISQFKSFDEE